MTSALSVHDLGKTYASGGTPVEALRGVSLEVEAGRFVAILGASGSGKSTLLYLLAGLDRPTAGRVTVAGRDLLALTDQQRTIFRRRHMGVIFQAYNLLPTLTALENVVLPGLIDGRPAATTRARAQALLERVGLGPRLHHRPQALSGGEQQRVAIARALVNQPRIILADEPTGNLDSVHSLEVWQLLSEVVDPSHAPGDADAAPPAVLAVTHEAAGAAHAHEVIVLRDGQVAGRFDPRAESGIAGEHNAPLVAARYAELVER